MEPHFGCHVVQGASLEVASSHPVLDGTKDVLDRVSADAHRARHAIEAGLHRLDHLPIFPPLDAALDAGGAVRLDGTSVATGRCGIAVERHAVLEAEEEAPRHRFTGGAAIGVGLGLVDEVLAHRPSAFAPEVSGLGQVAVMPAALHASTSGPEK